MTIRWAHWRFTPSPAASVATSTRTSLSERKSAWAFLRSSRFVPPWIDPTVTTAGDSLTLPKAAPGLRYKVINKAAANSLNVFPLAGDAINALAVNAAFALAATKSGEFISCASGAWDTFPIVP